MRRLVLLVGIIMVFFCGSSAWADLMSGSLSTPILYDSSAYGLQPQSARTPVASTPGGLVATAAWYDYGMKLSWDVTKNTADNTYTYHYLFGPGWYPATNPKADPLTTPPTEPYVTNKNITAFDIQLGTGITSLSQLTNLTWNVYQFNGPNGGIVGRVGTGDATSYQKCNPTTGALAGSKVNTSLLSIGNQTGEIGYTNQDTLDEYYVTSNLFYGLQWLNPLSNGNWVFSNDINFELTFTSTLAPGLGNFFTNSTRTGGNNNQSDVIAYNSTLTGYSPNMLTGQITLSNAIAAAGGAAPVPLPPSVLLFGSGLSGLFFFRRKKIEC
jgi:hypothetical protein